MRPLKLTISGFWPLRLNTQELDFSRLGTGGLYLITGDTGRQNHHFDAITYALFGEASGDGRDASCCAPSTPPRTLQLMWS